MAKVNYAVEQRLRMIEFLVDHFDHISRSHLQDFFGIGEACASRDIKHYNELAPHNLLYNEHSRRWIKADTFKRHYNA